MDHLAEQRVLDLIGGALADAVDVHEHLDHCEECRRVVAVALRTDATNVALGTHESTDVEHSTTLADMPRALRGERVPAVEHVAEYKLLELVGRGGMGTVYRALDTLLDREVAIKLIAKTSSEAARQRFLVEARAVARIRHPNVVVVHRVGIDPKDDRPYIVYDLVRGRTAAELEPPIPWFKAIEIGVGMTRGLAAAHACGVLHRDLKPANVMIDEHDDVILVDFGLAKLDTDGVDTRPIHLADTRMTVTGVAMGTPRYMAPESWSGQPPTPQTDIYGLGLVLYELLSGTLPFRETDIAELGRAVCSVDPPSVSTVAPWAPPVVCELVDRCIARDPLQRPVAASALAEQLEAIQRGRAFETFERDRVRRVPHGNPYPGSKPFGFEHQGVFFGRANEMRDVIDLLRSRPLVIVAGEPGAGKTSLCMAGVLPLVARGALAGARKWVPVPMTVGDDPFASLAAAIASHLERDTADLPRLLREDPSGVIDEFRAGHRGGCTAHVLFIDQLEDLVKLPRDDAEHFAALLARLCKPAPAFRVLASLRTSEMMTVAQLPGLSSAIGPALFLLLEPRDEVRLREIVVEPARLSGRSIGNDVAASLVAAAASGRLSLRELEVQLASFWERLPA